MIRLFVRFIVGLSLVLAGICGVARTFAQALPRSDVEELIAYTFLTPCSNMSCEQYHTVLLAPDAPDISAAPRLPLAAHDWSWSPDHRRAAFEGSHHIYLLDAGRRLIVNLTQAQALALHSSPVWAPDGERLAYASYNGADQQNFINLFEPASRQTVRIAFPSFIETLRWSPTGHLLAVLAAPTAAPRDVYIVDVASGSVTNITPGITDYHYISWSHDGARLAYVSTLAGTNQVHAMDSAGRDSEPLTSTAGAPASPSWGAGDRDIFYLTRVRELASLNRVELTTGARHVIFSAQMLLAAAFDSAREHVALVAGLEQAQFKLCIISLQTGAVACHDAPAGFEIAWGD